MAKRVVDGIPGPLEVRILRHGDECVAELDGELDISTSERLRAELVQLIEDGCRRLVIDMSNLMLIDSTGLGVLVGVLKRALQFDGEMVLRSPRPAARRVFDLTGLNRVFTVID